MTWFLGPRLENEVADLADGAVPAGAFSYIVCGFEGWVLGLGNGDSDAGVSDGGGVYCVVTHVDGFFGRDAELLYDGF